MHELLFIVAIVIVLLLLTWACWPSKSHRGKFHYGQSNGLTVIRFYRPTCPWCVRTQAAWDRFKTIANDIDVQEYDMDAGDYGQILASYGGSGVPYIVKVFDGQFETYKGDRSTNDLLAWVSQ